MLATPVATAKGDAGEKTEIKFLVKAGSENDVLNSLQGLSPAEGEKLDVWFFDSADLGCFTKDMKVILRARGGSKPDLTIKVRSTSAAIPTEFESWKSRQRPEGEKVKVERDQVYTTSGAKPATQSLSISVGRNAAEIETATAPSKTGESGKPKPIQGAFTKLQQELFHAFTGGSPGWDALRVLGPAHVRKRTISADQLKLPADDIFDSIDFERWEFGQGAEIVVMLEISVKAHEGKETAAADRLAKLIAEKKWLLADGQDAETKTKRLMDYFAKHP